MNRIRLTSSMRADGIGVVRQSGLEPSYSFSELTKRQVTTANYESLEVCPTSYRVQRAEIEAQRELALGESRDGAYSSETVNAAMANLDAGKIGLEMKGDPLELH